jgi:hypothetical protein
MRSYDAKITPNAINSFKQQFLQHECRRIFILNIQLEKHIIDDIRRVHINFNKFMLSFLAKIT